MRLIDIMRLKAVYFKRTTQHFMMNTILASHAIVNHFLDFFVSLSHSYAHAVMSNNISFDHVGQEPITRNLQLPHIPVTAFLHTDLFLV